MHFVLVLEHLRRTLKIIYDVGKTYRALAEDTTQLKAGRHVT